MGYRLRIVSANLLNGSAVPHAFVTLVQQLQGDIVNVQEVAPDQADTLAAALPFAHMYPEIDCTGMGIAARRPVTVRRLPLPDCQAYIAELRPENWPGLTAPLEIMNIHIAAPHHFPYWRPLRWRQLQLRAIQRHLDSGQRARVLIGDFNSTPLWPLYRRLAVRLTDAALVIAQRHGTTPAKTWGPCGRKLLRIDHAFVSGLTVADFQVVPVIGSDHSAIVLDAVLD